MVLVLLLVVIVVILVAAAAWDFAGRRVTRLQRRTGNPRATVIVLGDVERSPRIIRQAVELRDDGWEVTVVGYVEEGSALAGTGRIKDMMLREVSVGNRRRAGGVLYFLLAGVAAISRAISLLQILTNLPSQEVFLLQNPPCIPTFLVVFLSISVAHRYASVVIDWHNLAFTIMASSSNVPYTAIALARWYERAFGSLAKAHFSVSNALAEYLEHSFRLRNVTVLPDRPSEIFKPGLRISDSMRKELGLPVAGKGPIIISSTSWTPDEDFSVLLSALPVIDRELASLEAENKGLPDVITILITGRGPLRELFERDIRYMSLKKIIVKTAWLSYDDYVTALSGSDFGISLHGSSSGLDLPMKAVDMLGCGLPVLSPLYACVSELIQDGTTGFLFSSSDELAQRIILLVQDWPSGRDLEMLRENARRRFGGAEDKWCRYWQRVARPVLRDLVQR